MPKINIKTATLQELKNECVKLKFTPYGHNMIGIILNEVEKRFGELESIKLYKEYQI